MPAPLRTSLLPKRREQGLGVRIELALVDRVEDLDDSEAIAKDAAKGHRERSDAGLVRQACGGCLDEATGRREKPCTVSTKLAHCSGARTLKRPRSKMVSNGPVRGDDMQDAKANPNRLTQ